MNVYQSIKNTVSHFFGLWNRDTNNSNNRLAGNKRRNIAIDGSENIAPKRLKRFHTQTQTDVGGVGISQIFPTRSEKIQFMTRIGSIYTPSSTLSVGPRSWHISMDKNVTDLSSDEEYSDDNEVQIVGEESVRSRNPLSSIAAKNDLASSSHKDNEVEVVKVFKKGKELQKNGTQSELVNQHSSSLATFSHRKSSNFNLSSFKKDSRKNRSVETPKVTTLFMAIEMDSKQRYRALLDSFRDTTSISSSTALKSPQSFVNLQDVETKCKLSNPLTRKKTNIAKVDVIDLTKQNEKRRPARLPVKSRTDDGDDSDVEILPVKPVSRVNSCEQRCQTSRFYDDNFLKEMNIKWESKMKQIQQEVEEEQVKKKLYAKYNRSRQINDVEDRVRRCMVITDSIVLDEPVEEDKDKLPELTKEMEEKITAALVPKPPNEVVSEGFSLRITRRDMTTLAKLNWLNDEVINFYMNLLIERGKRENMPKVYAFNTFFYPQLIDRGFASLKRWTRKVDVFAHDLIAVPVHLGVHWCMAIIDLRNKVVEYYDSMGQSNDRCLSALLKYLELESLDKKNTPYDTSSWKTKNMSNIPQQMNGSDCGMFACTFAEYKCRNGKINFSQNDMPYFRRKMVYEILTGRLMMGN